MSFRIILVVFLAILTVNLMIDTKKKVNTFMSIESDGILMSKRHTLDCQNGIVTTTLVDNQYRTPIIIFYAPDGSVFGCEELLDYD